MVNKKMRKRIAVVIVVAVIAAIGVPMSSSVVLDGKHNMPLTGEEFSFVMTASFVLSAIIGMLVAACIKRDKAE